MLLPIVVESILKLFMIRSLFTILATIFRALLALFLIADLILVAFVGYKGSQPMQQVGANGMTYWQFMSDRIGALLLPWVFLISIVVGFFVSVFLGYLSTKRPLFQDKRVRQALAQAL